MNSINLATLMLTLLRNQGGGSVSYSDKVLSYTPSVFYRLNEDLPEDVWVLLVDSSGNNIEGWIYGSVPRPDLAASTFLDGSPVPYLTADSVSFDGLVNVPNRFSWIGTWMQWVKTPGSEDTDTRWLRAAHYTVDEGQNPDPNPCEIIVSKISSSQLRLRINRGTQVDTLFSYTPDEWMHIAIATNDTETKLYVNGVLEATITGYGTNNIPFDYAWDSCNFASTATGYVCNCAYWKDTILTAPQIADLATV